MHMVEVSSSNLNAVGYDPATQILRIEFDSGTYDYHDVPASVHSGLMSSHSKGKYHHQYIKNDYHYTKIN